MNDRAIFTLGAAALFGLSLAFTVLNPQAWRPGAAATEGPVARLLAAVGSAAAAAAPRGTVAPAADARSAGLPAPWLELRLADGRLVLDGTVPDAATHAALLSRTIARHGAANLDDRVIVRPTARAEAFDAGVADFPPDLSGVRRATVRLAGGGLSWQGDRPTGTAPLAADDAGAPAMATATAAPVGASSPAEATAASPPAAEPADEPVMASIHFTTNSVELTPKAQVLLGAAVARLRDAPDRRIDVVGHADARGDPTWNRTLSGLRARAVADWLQARGVARDRITVIGAGVDTAVPEAPDAMRQARRVELRLG